MCFTIQRPIPLPSSPLVVTPKLKILDNDRWCDPNSLVDHHHLDPFALSLDGNGHVRTRLTDRLTRVPHDIEQNLACLTCIGLNDAVALNLDVELDPLLADKRIKNKADRFQGGAYIDRLPVLSLTNER